MLNKISSELIGVLGLVLIVLISFIGTKIFSIPFLWVFFIIAAITWVGLHLKETRLRKEIDSRDDRVFDVQPEEVVLRREKFEPPLLAYTKEKNGKEYQVEVVQRITTKDHVFVGFRKVDSGEEAVSLESDLFYLKD